MEKPAGVQIKTWFLTLVFLLLLVNIISVVSLFIVYGKIDDIKGVYQPIVKSSALINEKIMSAQINLYEYLSEYRSDLEPVFVKTDDLAKELKKIKTLAEEKKIASFDLKLIDGILEATQSFEKAIKRLEETEKEGAVDWERINALRNYAVDMGKETFNKAASVSNDINLVITNHNIRVTLIALIVVCILFAFLIITVIIMIQLHYWWRRFEDLILEL